MVQIGDYVTVKYLEDEKVETYKLVSIEHNYINMGNDHRGDNDLYYIDELKLDDVHFENNEISDESPLGRALINSNLGEVVSFTTPDFNTVHVKIISIHHEDDSDD